jgi:hypothetical protein
MIPLNKLSYEVFSHKHDLNILLNKDRKAQGIYENWYCDTNFYD